MQNMQVQSNNQFPAVAQSQIGDGEIQTVNARDLHKFLEVTTQFKDWITRRIQDYDFEEGKDFSSFLSESSGGRPSKEYAISIDMVKELSMVERNEKGKQARSYFIDCERRLRDESHTLKALNDPASLRGLLLENVEKVIALEQQIEQDKPKTQFYDAFVNSEGLYGLQNAARATHHKPNLYIRWLKQDYLFYQGGNLIPRAQYIQMGIFEVKLTTVNEKDHFQTFITPKGLEYLAARAPDYIKVNGRTAA